MIKSHIFAWHKFIQFVQHLILDRKKNLIVSHFSKNGELKMEFKEPVEVSHVLFNMICFSRHEIKLYLCKLRTIKNQKL